mmetsp:Transcript_41552/g.130965  ORF Transcript_41552/g.130965 Transcript_41552/m.130965 type:complete len:143 (+) Transcript_41552:352-780(+)
MLAKFAEDERIEQMNAQRRRMKMLEHKREVERLIEERRQMYEEEKEVMYSGGSRAEVKNDVAGGAGGAERRGEKSPGEGDACLVLPSSDLLQALRELIEQERQRILREAAGKLGLEYMPRGVLASKEDLEMFKAAQHANKFR